jgi:nitroreductase
LEKHWLEQNEIQIKQLQQWRITRMTFQEMLERRESCRAYSDRPVSREDLMKLVEAGRLSPSGCNAQPWKFIVVDDPEAKKNLCDALVVKKSVGASCNAETVLIRNLSGHTDSPHDAIETLRHGLENVPKQAEAAAMYYHDTIVPGMNALRTEADLLESLTEKSYWPYPTYSDILFY